MSTKKALYTHPHLKQENTSRANALLIKLNEYKALYLKAIDENATIATISKDAMTVDEPTIFIHKKKAKKIAQLRVTFPEISEDKAAALFEDGIKPAAIKLTELTKEIRNIVRATGGILSVDNFVMKDVFSINSKVTDRVNKAATTYCANDKQFELKAIAERLSKIVKEAIKDGHLASNRSGIIAENLINISTGKVRYDYIQRQ